MSAKEFHSRIDIATINTISTVEEQTVTLKNGAVWIKCTSNSEVKPTDNAKTGKAGKHYEQKLTITIDKLSDTDKSKLNQGIKSIIKLHTDNSELIWGNMDTPCKISLSPGTQSDTLEITRTSLKPLL